MIFALSSRSFEVERWAVPVVRDESKGRKSGECWSVEASRCHSEAIGCVLGRPFGGSPGVENMDPGLRAGDAEPGRCMIAAEAHGRESGRVKFLRLLRLGNSEGSSKRSGTKYLHQVLRHKQCSWIRRVVCESSRRLFPLWFSNITKEPLHPKERGSRPGPNSPPSSEVERASFKRGGHGTEGDNSR